jgi:hypothetical protein
MDKKVLYALTTKIFNTLKKLGIKPKIGVTTDIQRLPGINSFNADLSNLKQARPESLKKLITTDADFLAKANPDELRQYYNNLEYLQSNFPDTFSKAEVVTEAKTGIKTLVDDLNENLKGKKSMETVNPKTGEVTSPKEPITTAKNEISEAEMIKQKYGNIIDDNLLKQILVDDNPQRKAEVLASIDEAIKMQEKGIPYEEIINIMKNTTRTKQAKGGLIKGVSYKSMFNNLDKTLNKGLGTMFRKKR